MAGDRILAVHGWDLRTALPDLDPAARVASGSRLVALDTEAAVRLTELALPFRTVEEELDAAGVPWDDVAVAAEDLAVGWTRGVDGPVTDPERLLPEWDPWRLGREWTAAVVASRLALALRRGGAERLTFLRDRPGSGPENDRVPGEMPGAVWSRLLGPVADPITHPQRRRDAGDLRTALSATPVGATGRAVRARSADRRFRRELGAHVTSSGGRGIALALLPHRELVRSRPILLALQQELDQDLVLAPWEPTPARVGATPILDEVPSVLLPAMEIPQRRSVERFRVWLGRSIDRHPLGELKAVRAELRAAVVAYAERLARHAERLRWATQVLQQFAPGLVITTRNDLPYEVPTRAAMEAGIPVLTLPHGVVASAPLQGGRVDRVAHLGGTVNPADTEGVIRVCAAALVEYEYPHRVERPPEVPTATLRVLALTEAAAGISPLSLGWSREAAAHRALDAAARHLGDTATVAVKPHPGTAPLAPLLVGRSDPALRSLPREADLLALLDRTDVVVAVNTFGSALVHAVRRSIPLVRLTTRPAEVDPAHSTRMNRPWAEFWAAHAPVARDADELIAVLSRLRDDDAYRAELVGASRRAALALVPPERLEPLGAVMRDLLGPG